ncbi:hypothetical protein AJ87_29670 [Rhizobium yanglingense]|nr:hypothetical protein AJ87_29670 [Rhizobium yanglingense]
MNAADARSAARTPVKLMSARDENENQPTPSCMGDVWLMNPDKAISSPLSPVAIFSASAGLYGDQAVQAKLPTGTAGSSKSSARLGASASGDTVKTTDIHSRYHRLPKPAIHAPIEQIRRRCSSY